MKSGAHIIQRNSVALWNDWYHRSTNFYPAYATLWGLRMLNQNIIRNPLTKWIFSIVKSRFPAVANFLVSLVVRNKLLATPKINPSLDDLPADIANLSTKYSERNMNSFLLDSEMIDRQNFIVANAVSSFFSNTNSYRGIDKAIIAKGVAEFREHYLANPITMNIYGANFPSGINLFLMARCLAPSVIVESGVYKGQSSYFLSCACPATPIHSFDPNLNELKYRAPGVTFYESEWMDTDITCDPVGSGFCFFDDHQNQALQILQAHRRGFRHLLFDNSWPIEVINAGGYLPVPSIDMLIGPPLETGRIVKWVESGRFWTYIHDENMQQLCDQARRLIKAAYDVPSLYRETGVPTTSAYKFVELY